MSGDFLVRSVVPAITTRGNDFSDPMVGAHLWRRGQNPYDVALAKATAKELTGSQMRLVPVYPPPAYLIVTPLTVLPWKWAKILWILLSTASVALVAFSLVRIGHFTINQPKAWLLIAVAFAFRPFHTAIQVGNVVVITAAICLVAIELANRCHDVASGVLLAIATCLKPQNCIWIFAFYLFTRRWRVVVAGVLSGLALTGAAVVRIPLSVSALIANYRANVHYWFGPGGENDFTSANPFRFPLVNLQVVFFPLVHRTAIANALALAIFASGFVVWAYAILRGGGKSVPLGISSLLALSFVAVYHRVNDAGVLTLALCWALGESGERLKWAKRSAVLMVLILAAGQSVLSRAAPYLPSVVTNSWWWNLLLVPYFAWTLLALSMVLLYAVLDSARRDLSVRPKFSPLRPAAMATPPN
jgi:Glycosyltransferase family 87